jgi:tRNA G18 (ribose-2'-O)-methylase SpoU
MEKINYQTVIVADGLSYCNNAGIIVRQCALLGATKIYFCPIDEERLSVLDNKINKRPIKDFVPDDDFLTPFGNYQLKNFKKDTSGSIAYTRSFKDSINKFSVDHQKFIEIEYDKNVADVVEHGIKNGFTIFKLENTGDPKDTIYKKQMNQEKIMIIVGNESQGISKQIMSDNRIIPLYIPSQIPVDSYNAANATIIATYERFRSIN